MNKKSPIILPEDLAKAHAMEYALIANAQLGKEARKEINKVKFCPRCSKSGKLKAVPLYEEPIPLPTKIVMVCSACGYNKAIMARESDKRMKYYNNEIQKIINQRVPKPKKETPIKDSALLDKLVPGDTSPPNTNASK